MEYRCKICNKEYSSYQSLWIHNKRYHNPNVTPNDFRDFQTTSNDFQATSSDFQNKIICEYCKKLSHEEIT